MRYVLTILALATPIPILGAQELTAPVLGGPDHHETTFECRVHAFSDVIIADYFRSRAKGTRPHYIKLLNRGRFGEISPRRSFLFASYAEKFPSKNRTSASSS